jgi:ribosomal protein S18 acetylase RimI-like enzyme
MRKITNKEEIIELLLKFSPLLPHSVVDNSTDRDKFAEKIYNNATTYVIYDGTDPAGFIAFYASDTRQSAYVTLLAVTPIHQGTLVADSLLNKCIEISSSLNKKSIKLEVNKNNIRAIKFYKKNGFNISDHSPKDSYYMEKSLD